MGVGMALASFSALFGPPVSGAMIDKYGGFEEVTYFCGAIAMLGAIITIGAKAKSPKGLFGKTS